MFFWSVIHTFGSLGPEVQVNVLRHMAFKVTEVANQAARMESWYWLQLRMTNNSFRCKSISYG